MTEKYVKSGTWIEICLDLNFSYTVNNGCFLRDLVTFLLSFPLHTIVITTYYLSCYFYHLSISFLFLGRQYSGQIILLKKIQSTYSTWQPSMFRRIKTDFVIYRQPDVFLVSCCDRLSWLCTISRGFHNSINIYSLLKCPMNT